MIHAFMCLLYSSTNKIHGYPGKHLFRRPGKLLIPLPSQSNEAYIATVKVHNVIVQVSCV